MLAAGRGPHRQHLGEPVHHGPVRVRPLRAVPDRRRGAVPGHGRDPRDTGATVNLLLPGGATATGMLPPGVVPEGQEFPEPALTGPPIVWLASDKAGGEKG